MVKCSQSLLLKNFLSEYLMKYTWLTLLPILALGLSGCKQQKTVKKRTTAATNMSANKSKTTHLAFDEDTDAFILEDENPFGTGINLAKNEQLDFSWEEPEEFKNEMLTVNFDYDSHKVQPSQETKLAMDIQKRKDQVKKGQKICVKGHACKWHGTKAYNLALSDQRAHEVAKRYEQEGIPSSCIKVVGMGNEEPITLANSKDGQAPNRRAEVIAIAA